MKLVKRARFPPHQPLIGELVMLASGSPPLRVTLVERNMAHVEWSAGFSVFPVACLWPYAERQPGLRVL